MTTSHAKNAGLSELGRRTVDPPISWLMKMTLDHPHIISLAAGFTDNESLPVAEAKRALLSVWRSKSAAQRALQYGSTMGDPKLRQFTAADLGARDRHAAASDAPYAPERVLMTHGSQQLLYMVVECLCDPGDVILVEDPTYFVYLSIAQSHALRCHGIKLEPDGIDLQQLEKTLARLKRSGEITRTKMLYLVSYFQNPSGVTTAFEKKKAALDLLRHYERAAGHPIYLLEDAAYRELKFAGADEASSLAAKGSLDRVIYAGTYSKPFATGARVGFGLLPPALYEVVHRVKGNHDFGTANLLQQLLLRAIESGDYRRHLPVMQSRYARKAEIMTKALGKHFPSSVAWEPPRGGLYVWAQAPEGVSTGAKSKVFQQALARDVLYVPGALCYADDPTRPKPDREMRLSFGGASEEAIRRGIARLGAVLHAQLDKS